MIKIQNRSAKIGSTAILTLTWVFFSTLTALGQVPIPAKAQSKPIALVGGTAHLGTGEVIENAVIAFDAGKLTVVADAASANVDTATHQVIDVKGRHIYPGFILPNTDLGLAEVSAMRASIDRSEAGDMNPNVRSIIAYNTDSEMIPTLRYNGILLAQTTPTGGVFPGTSSLVALDGWNWEDAVYHMDDGVHLNWPNRMRRRFDFRTFTVKTEPNKEYDAMIQRLGNFFADAASYGKLSNPPAINLKLKAMQGLFSGKQTLYINANQAKSMVESVVFAKKHGVQRIVIIGGAEALTVTDFLLEHKIPIVLTDVHRRPDTEDGDVDAAYKLPHQLHQAGVLFCLGYNGTMSSRNLPFYAGTAAAYGMDKEAALQAITANTAKILGIGDRTGSLEVGKDATLFVSAGDALDMRTNRLEHAFIQGKAIQLDARQQALFEKYKAKYGHQ